MATNYDAPCMDYGRAYLLYFTAHVYVVRDTCDDLEDLPSWPFHIVPVFVSGVRVICTLSRTPVLHEMAVKDRSTAVLLKM